MNKYTLVADTVISLITGALISLFGDAYKAVIALLCIMILDFISGYVKGAYKKNLDSRVSFKGILKKLLIITVVLYSTILQKFILPDNTFIISTVVMFYICNESLSFIENVGTILPIPDNIKSILTQLQYGKDNTRK